MSFLKKFLGIATEPPPREKIPRAPRIRLQNIHHLILTSPRWNGQIMRLLNISTTGLAVEDCDKPDDLVQGSVFPAMLTINQRSFPILIRIAHIAPELIGLSFEGENSQLQKAIFDYFIAEISGMQVTEVNPKLLKPDPRGDAHWFFGSNNSEIYFTQQENQVTYFHITLLGNYIEGYSDQPPRFGYVLSQEGQNKMKPDQSSLIRFTEEMPESTIELVMRFVRHVEALSQPVRAYLLSTLDELKEEQHAKNMQV